MQKNIKIINNKSQKQEFKGKIKVNKKNIILVSIISITIFIILIALLVIIDKKTTLNLDCVPNNGLEFNIYYRPLTSEFLRDNINLIELADKWKFTHDDKNLRLETERTNDYTNCDSIIDLKLHEKECNAKMIIKKLETIDINKYTLDYFSMSQEINEITGEEISNYSYSAKCKLVKKKIY